jgi:tripartite-type tricarboxylate transporter receptor subunit TctC
MKKNVYCLTLALLVLVLLFCPVSLTMAQGDYPTRAIEVIIAWPPGGPTDLTTRLFAEKWSEFLEKPVVVVNKPGGGAILGSKLVANAKPDGYTLFSANDANLITGRLGKKDAGFDLDSFHYFFSTTTNLFYLIVKADSKWKSMEEFVRDAKQNPGKLTYGAMMGTGNHYLAEMFSKAAGVKLAPVFFKSSPEIMTALLGGHVDLASMGGLSGMSGSPLIRVLAISEEKRISAKPDLPTLKEMGYPVIYNAINVLCGPKAIPDKVVGKFIDAHNKVVAKYEKEIKQGLQKMDIEFTFLDGKSVLKLLKEKEKQYHIYAPLVGIKLK